MRHSFLSRLITLSFWVEQINHFVNPFDTVLHRLRDRQAYQRRA